MIAIDAATIKQIIIKCKVYTDNYANYYMYRFADCCWISLVIGGTDWEFRVRGNLTYREDTGLVNSSPVVNIPPLVRIQQGCSHTIKIPGKGG